MNTKQPRTLTNLYNSVGEAKVPSTLKHDPIKLRTFSDHLLHLIFLDHHITAVKVSFLLKICPLTA